MIIRLLSVESQTNKQNLCFEAHVGNIIAWNFRLVSKYSGIMVGDPVPKGADTKIICYGHLILLHKTKEYIARQIKISNTVA